VPVMAIRKNSQVKYHPKMIVCRQTGMNSRIISRVENVFIQPG